MTTWPIGPFHLARAGAEDPQVREFRGHPGPEGALGLPDEFNPIVIPVGRHLPIVRSPSLKRGWVPFEDFAHWDCW